MFIKSLTLCGNKRLLAADIKYLHVDFTSVHQIILGLNGSGKSSTIQELNPMPGIPADYIKGGYKHITLEHNNQNYELLSLFGSHPRHSFKLNGNELNEGGTGSVQKMLVLEHFALDQSLIEVLTDQTRFHMFTPIERRNWLTRLSGTNMDYAIGLFKHIKSLHRDSEAIVKHIDARLAKESSDIIPPETLVELEEYCKELETTVLKLLEHKSIDESDPNPTLNELTRLVTEARQLGEHIVSLKFTKPLEGIYDKESLVQYKHYLDNKITTLTTTKEEMVKEWATINDAIKTVEMTDNKGLSEIDEERKSYITKHSELKKRLKTYHDISNPEPLYGATDAIKNTLIHMVTELSDNSDSMFTRDKVTEATANAQDLRRKINSLGNEVERLKLTINRMTEVDEVDCPNCKTTFKPGVDPTVVESLKNKGRGKSEEIVKLKESLEEVDNYLGAASTYTAEYRSILKLMDDAPSLNPVWNNMKQVDLKTLSPAHLLSVFEEWERDLQVHLKMLKYVQEVKRLDGQRDKLQAVVDSEVNYTQSRLAQVTTQIEENIKEQKDVRIKQEEVTRSLTCYDAIMKGYERFMVLNQKHRDLKDKFMSESVQSELRNMISKLNLTLAGSDAKLQAARGARATLEDLTTQKEEAVERREVLKALVKELNPTDGLIAKQSKLFIEQFVEQINKVINAVWTYEMAVLPSPTESDKLTYKFPIYFSATDVATPDIAKSSAAQKGIIDFAFKLVVMAYMGLSDYPLYLDELAPSLDEKHRANIMIFVKNFVESKQCSQMFMISHYLNESLVFRGAEVIILDEANLLTVPDSFNKHVVVSSKMKAWVEEDITVAV